MRHGRLTLLLLIALYLAAIVAVQPTGNFPLNDDWSYAAAARNFALGHDWRPTGWTSMPLITQAVWAAPFCILSDCSSEALRAASLASGLVLLVSTYYLLATVTRSAFAAGLGAATAAFNPVTFELSHTFMTDTLFAALIATAALAFVKTFRSNSISVYALACLLAVAATLCRQLGLCVPIAYMAAVAFSSDQPGRKIIRALFPVLLCVAALVLFEQWMRQTGRLPALNDSRIQDILGNFRQPGLVIRLALVNLATAFLYLGLFCLPILILFRPAVVEDSNAVLRWAPKAVAAAATLAACAALWWILGLMPVGNNILIPQGLGPLTLRDTYVLGLPNVPPLPPFFWGVVTAASLIGLFRLVELVAAFAVTFVNRGNEARTGRQEGLFAFVCVAVYVAPLMVAGFFDRYLAAIAPIVLLFAIASTPSTQARGIAPRTLAGAMCACFLVFAVLATHDYLSWNRARWQAIADLQRLERANSSNIDGGFEFNGITSYDPKYERNPDKSWWWVKDDTYQITFGPVAGMTELRRYPYVNWLPPATRYIHVLRR